MILVASNSVTYLTIEKKLRLFATFLSPNVTYIKFCLKLKIKKFKSYGHKLFYLNLKMRALS